MKKESSRLKILVTGSSGFIGKHLTKRLNDYDIIKDDKTNIEFFKKKGKKSPNIDVIIHLGGKTPYSKKLRFIDFLDANLKSTLQVLDFCIENKIKKLIFVSSYVYGKPTMRKVNELQHITPHSPYTMSKFLAEQVCEFYSRTYGLNVIILRPFNIFGREQKKGFIIPNLINAAKTGKKIVMINKKSKRDFLYVDDFVDLIEKLIKIDLKNEVFNVGCGKSYSFEQIIKKIENITNKKIKVKYLNDPSILIPDIVADISKIRKKTGWIPKMSFDDGLKILLNS
ncbi:MAG TPA: NAD(P)-dependent oxidoreductase [Candidatus Nitrosotalea sp.]|nr:NAD(P)-dependent oxidoreductase [Candidatus Nitrosotalea sp.]